MFRNVFDRTGLYTYLLRILFDYKLMMNPETVPILIMLHGIWYRPPSP